MGSRDPILPFEDVSEMLASPNKITEAIVDTKGQSFPDNGGVSIPHTLTTP